MTDWLRLNVGGTMFETSRTTLTSDPDSILSRMFEPNSNLPPATVTKGGAYLIDACPRGFEVVLNYLRYRSLVLGPNTKATDVLPVADYFGLQDLRVLLERHQEKEAEERLKMTSCIEESVEKLEAVLQCVECEVSALNEKLEDLKIEVGTSLVYRGSKCGWGTYLSLNVDIPDFPFIKLLISVRCPRLPRGWRTSGGSSASWPTSRKSSATEWSASSEDTT